MGFRKCRAWCVIFAVILALSGMYFEKNEVHSSLACPSVEKNNSYIKSAHTTITDAQVCTTEMLGVQYTGRVQQLTARLIRPGKTLITLHNFLYSDYLSLPEGKFFTSLEITQIYCGCLDELVINYIHNLDGKKRIECTILFRYAMNGGSLKEEKCDEKNEGDLYHWTGL